LTQIPMQETLSIIHFSDIHVWKTTPLWSDCLYPKRILGGLNLLLNRRSAFLPHLGKAVIADILTQDADLVIFSGDMTTASHPSEFAACAKLFAPLYEKWGDRFFVIPGNHDRYSPKSIAAGWYEQYFPYGTMDQDLQVKAIETPSGKPITLVGIDASQPFCFRSNGRLKEDLASRLEATLKELNERDQNVILVGHYPIYYPQEVPQAWNHILLNKSRLQEIVETYQPLLYLHGHKHQRWAINNTINSGSCGMLSENKLKQAGYVQINYQNETYSVNMRYLGSQGTFLTDTLQQQVK